MPSTFLTCKEQERLACFPDDIQQWDLITYFTLTEHDCSLIDTYQGESNRLGAALQLCAVRYLGFCPANLNTASSDMTAFLARQLKVDPSVLQDYGQRRMGLYKDSCKSGHRTWMEVLPHIIRAVFMGIILPIARLIRAVGHDPIG